MQRPEGFSTTDILIRPLPGLDLRLLRYVIAVAEELHFTRASMRLHLATPSLSRQIRQLEEALGYALFDRQTRAVALTPAGVAFVADARRALLHARRAVEAGALANAGDSHAIRVGYTPLLGVDLLMQITHELKQALQGTPLLLQSTYSVAQIDQVLDGRLDLGLVVPPVADDELTTVRLFKSCLVAAVPEHSDLAARPLLVPRDMAGQAVIWFGRLTNPHLYRYFLERCEQAGFTPNVAWEVSTVVEVLGSVAAGLGLGFVTDSIPSRLCPKGIVFREIAPPGLSIEVGAVYRDETRSTELPTVLRVLRQLSIGLSQQQ
jgi:DNA-binding transcriptional LysR family regulator